MRPGWITPPRPQVRSNISSVSMPSEIPDAHSNSVAVASRATRAPSTPAIALKPKATNRTPAPIPMAATVVLGWIEIPLLAQSVRRRRSNAQPANDSSPPSNT